GTHRQGWRQGYGERREDSPSGSRSRVATGEVGGGHRGTQRRARRATRARPGRHDADLAGRFAAGRWRGRGGRSVGADCPSLPAGPEPVACAGGQRGLLQGTGERRAHRREPAFGRGEIGEPAGGPLRRAQEGADAGGGDDPPSTPRTPGDARTAGGRGGPCGGRDLAWEPDLGGGEGRRG